MQVPFPGGFVRLFQNPGESSADPGMDSSNLVRFNSRKSFTVFLQVLCMFEQDFINFSSAVQRRQKKCCDNTTKLHLKY